MQRLEGAQADADILCIQCLACLDMWSKHLENIANFSISSESRQSKKGVSNVIFFECICAILDPELHNEKKPVNLRNAAERSNIVEHISHMCRSQVPAALL
jgi:hypothetical protein